MDKAFEILYGLSVFGINTLIIFVLWNSFIPNIFPLHEISYIDTMALYILVSTLLGRPLVRFIPRDECGQPQVENGKNEE